MSDGLRRWLPEVIMVIVGTAFVIVLLTAYPLNPDNPNDIWGHLLFVLPMTAALWLIDRLVRRAVGRNGSPRA